MADTPNFPAWRRRFGAGALATAFGRLRRCTLDQVEARFGPLVGGLAALDPARASARERPYSVRRTYWCFIWQMLQRNASCRAVVQQLLAMFALEGRPALDAASSAYCQARARLPEPLLQAALRASAQAADHRVAPSAALQGRVVKVMDGTSLALPDTAQNQAAYPQPASQQPGCGFPRLNLLVVWSARSGTVRDHARGDLHASEMGLLHQVAPTLAPQDIVIYDRAAGHFMACALLTARGVDLISRVHTRRTDWRRGQRLGPDQRLVVWPKTRQPSAYLDAAQWAELPAQITVRLIRVRVRQKGFRARELTLVTTLLDPGLYPADQIVAAYLRRWRLEMCLDDLKTTLGLDALRCQSPAMIHREILALLIAHNLVRAVMAEAAAERAVPLDRLSFTGTLDALRSFGRACAQTARPRLQQRLWVAMLRVIAADLVPLRPDRWEPRAVKHRPKTYARLNRPRHQYRQIRHGSLHRRTKT
jgi:hypothetical protein